VLDQLTSQLRQGSDLSATQVSGAVASLTDEAVAAETKADFLTALAQKGETAEEIAAFARELRGMSIQPPLAPETRAQVIVDVVGTGGDGMRTFNISTAAAIIVAAAGVTVAKHGNRAVTSQTGSADVLEALGVPIDLTPEQAAQSLRDRHFAFFFAPQYHPAFRHIAPARKLCAGRGQRTIFNFLGPLLNPARPAAQLTGVPRPELCEPIARVLQSLGLRRAMVVCGSAREGPAEPVSPARPPCRYLDELSTLGETALAEFYQDRAPSVSSLAPGLFPVQRAALADLAGGDRQANAQMLRRLLAGEDRGPKRDILLLNAGAALLVAGKAQSIIEGWELAAELIDRGQAKAKLEELAVRTG